ncbi:MAG: RidA family protein [Nitrospinota bacterium]|jgi:2-iminobutanoate/2-iminopropanoate deaminase/2-aminomuconate deaminase|nr:RidA family protein [Nitrospinota bacterium]MDP7168914.1 RidA family protein [Nitrospinota bacterium]MDP7371269.1 RidA family protein [Nitrospinota bacterium]
MVDGIEAIHPKPEEAHTMPYAPGIYVEGGSDILFLSGSTTSPLYHKHPHVPEEHIQPDDIKEQTRRVMENIKLVLDAKGLNWRNVVKVTKYFTDNRERNDVNAVMSEYFGDWRPASTGLCVQGLSSPGARLELDMIAIAPRNK